jgi:hypothetical protein
MSSVNHNRRTGLSSPRANLAAAFGQIPESILLILNDLHKSIRQITASLPKPTASREPAADCQSILPAATPSAAGAVGRTSWPASAFSTFFEVLSKQMWRRHSCLQRRDFRGSDLCRASRRPGRLQRGPQPHKSVRPRPPRISRCAQPRPLRRPALAVMPRFPPPHPKQPAHPTSSLVDLPRD